MNEKLLNPTFWGLMFAPPALMVISRLISSDPHSANAMLASLFALGAVISNLTFFFMDRAFLVKSGVMPPAWGWVFLQPVYIFKRLKDNGLPMFWFAVYMGCHLILPRLAALVH